jgi:hypothetical protein
MNKHIQGADDLEAAMTDFLAFLQKLTTDYYTQNFTNLTAPEFKIMRGQRYIRVVRDEGVSRSAFCFIDTGNGDILKPAGWNAPAKHARANLYDKATWKNVGPYGPAYLRRGTIREAMQVLAAFEGMVKLMNEAAKQYRQTYGKDYSDDANDLKEIGLLISSGRFDEAAKKADLLDTLVREYIPAKVWDFLQSAVWK